MYAEPSNNYFRLQFTVFALVAASFTNIYITQPLLPVLQTEFATSMVIISTSISAVIFGITLANLPFGALADKIPIQPIILGGGIMVALSGLICALTDNLGIFIGARFLQGLFIPALTTCLAAYLAKTLPPDRLNVVMGSYVSATVCGGLGGRLLGGWVNRFFDWRYALLGAAALILITVIIALLNLPRNIIRKDVAKASKATTSFLSLLINPKLRLIYACAAGSFAIFSSLFNYLPFRLAAAPFNLSSDSITLVYLVYIVGIFTGPKAGRLCNRIGSGPTMIRGTAIFAFSLLILTLPHLITIITGLLGVCAGFFTIHAAAIGTLNRKLDHAQGRANALYVLSYYLGGCAGITISGLIYENFGWSAVIIFCLTLLSIPLLTGLNEKGNYSINP
ncbi:MAG: MFS transporter [Deltaproteobacteria bacterium]|nr:MFS transporter [Candidatus Tharpella sp.]